MSLLVDGKMQADWLDAEREAGEFVRQESRFRNWVTRDGSPGPSGQGGFRAEPGRYHLYVSLACPWAHRTLIFRRLKGLERAVGVSVVHPWMGPEGWAFSAYPGATPDAINGADHLHEIYTRADPGYSGIVTVPVLWDTRRETIVNNESSEIIRMFSAAFDVCGASGPDFYPEPLRPAIDAVNERVYAEVNNGVYRAGFAATQSAHERAVRRLFAALDWLEERLARQRYLVGDTLTEADWRLFTTLVRFDAVYHTHFKCNVRRLVDFPNLWDWTRELYQVPGVAETVNLDHIKRHYYTSHPELNPRGLIPVGPELDFTAPAGRG